MIVEIPIAIKINMILRDINPYYRTKFKFLSLITKKDRHSFLVAIAAKPIAEVRIRKLAVINRARDAVKLSSIACRALLF